VSCFPGPRAASQSGLDPAGIGSRPRQSQGDELGPVSRFGAGGMGLPAAWLRLVQHLSAPVHRLAQYGDRIPQDLLMTPAARRPRRRSPAAVVIEP
jgi:hypothetical protein